MNTETALKPLGQKIFVEYARAGMFIIILIVAIVTYLFQPGFVFYSFLKNYYFTILFGLSIHLYLVFVLRDNNENQFEKVYQISFFIDAVLIAVLVYLSGTQQSLFLVLNLINIFLCGYLYQARGAIFLATVTSFLFSINIIFGPDMRPLNLVLTLALQNLSFFIMAGLSGYLSEQLKEVGVSLQSLEEMNRVIMENMPSGVFSFLKSGVIIQNNPKASELFENRTLIQENIFNYIPELKNKLLHIDSFEMLYKNKNYHFRINEVYSPALNEQIHIAVLEDRTLLRELEGRLRQSEKLAAIGGLAAGVAHEIRNPLAGISGSIELLSQNVDSDDDRKLMKIILKEIDRLNNLISEFLDYAKPQTSPTDPVNLSMLILDVVNSLQSDARLRKDVTQTRFIAPDVFILGHADKLKQALLNIFINAFQAMYDVAKAELKISLEKNNNEVILKIADTGCGMSDETQKKLFEPFHTTKSKGTGLGLAITYKILESHKSQILVRSEKNVGTEFTLTFPLFRK